MSSLLFVSLMTVYKSNASHHTTLNLSVVLRTDRYDGAIRAISLNLPNLRALNISESCVQASAIELPLPTIRNPLRGCSELVVLNLKYNSLVTVKLLKKIILRLPKLQYLKHTLLMKTLSGLTEKEMDEDGRCLRCFYSDSLSD